MKKNHAKTEADFELMRSYSLLVEEHHQIYPTNAGLLLFGKDPQFYLSETIIICCHMKRIEGREAYCFCGLCWFFTQSISSSPSIHFKSSFSLIYYPGMVREEKLEIPEVAFREALLKLIHRNYHPPAPSKNFIYDDRLEFFSPGNFWGPIRQDQLLRGITYLRNPSICKVFRESGLVEKMGTGFIQKADVQQEDLFSLFYEKEEITIHDVINKYSVSRATAQRWLQALVSEGKIERIGKTRSVRYGRKASGNHLPA